MRKLPRAAQRLIIDRLEALGQDPRPPDCTKLRGVTGLYRVREGEYRLIYTAMDNVMIVLALSVAHRKEVYRDLSELERLAKQLAKELLSDLP